MYQIEQLFLNQEKYSPSLMLAYRIGVVFNETVEKLYCLNENIKKRIDLMKIKNKRNYVAGVICTLLVPLVLVLYIFSKENRLIVSFILLIAMAVFNFQISLSKKEMFEKARELNDERDQYLTMKTNHLLISL
ncbi:MAG: hypothetical protein RR252_07970 [Longicatena sp.]